MEATTDGRGCATDSPLTLVRSWSLCLVQDVEVFAGLEADGFTGGDADLGACAGVPSDAGFAGLYGEDTEAAELDAISLDEALLHGVEDGVDRCFSFGAYQAGTLDDSLDEILFDQR